MSDIDTSAFPKTLFGYPIVWVDKLPPVMDRAARMKANAIERKQQRRAYRMAMKVELMRRRMMESE